MAWQGFDKRKFPRINVNLEASISCKNTNTKSKAFALNIGIGGISLYSDKKYSLYDQIEIEFTIPLLAKNYTISCAGQVMWVVKTVRGTQETYDIGIEFLNLKVKDKQLIERYIESIV